MSAEELRSESSQTSGEHQTQKTQPRSPRQIYREEFDFGSDAMPGLDHVIFGPISVVKSVREHVRHTKQRRHSV